MGRVNIRFRRLIGLTGFPPEAASGVPDDISRDLSRPSRTGHLSVPPRWVQMTEVTRGTATRHVPTTDSVEDRLAAILSA